MQFLSLASLSVIHLPSCHFFFKNILCTSVQVAWLAVSCCSLTVYLSLSTGYMEFEKKGIINIDQLDVTLGKMSV